MLAEIYNWFTDGFIAPTRARLGYDNHQGPKRGRKRLLNWRPPE